MKFEFQELEYSYEALEPFFDKETMEIHHTKHYKAYLDKALAALDGKKDLIVEEVLLTDLREGIQNNAGGFYNHSIFWKILGKNDGNGPNGKVKELINGSFGSFDKFKEQFSTAAATLFGSGWVWLVHDENEDTVEIITRCNQNHPITDKRVLMGLDVWEHAYYLKYQNKRPEYIEAFFNVVNWQKVEERLGEKVFSLG